MGNFFVFSLLLILLVTIPSSVSNARIPADKNDEPVYAEPLDTLSDYTDYSEPWVEGVTNPSASPVPTNRTRRVYNRYYPSKRRLRSLAPLRTPMTPRLPGDGSESSEENQGYTKDVNVVQPEFPPTAAGRFRRFKRSVARKFRNFKDKTKKALKNFFRQDVLDSASDISK